MALENLVRYLILEWSVILQAPAIFMTAIILAGLFLWSVFRWSYSNRIETLDGRLKLRDNQISDYWQNLSGATPEEARNRIDALELQIATLAPRRLNLEQRQKIVNVMRSMKCLVNVTRDLGANDSRKLTQDFVETFGIAGWIVQTPQVMGIGNPPISGIALKIHQISDLRPAELILKSALEAANISFDLQPGLQINPPGFQHMSFKPNPDVELLISSPLDRYDVNFEMLGSSFANDSSRKPKSLRGTGALLRSRAAHRQTEV